MATINSDGDRKTGTYQNDITVDAQAEGRMIDLFYSTETPGDKDKQQFGYAEDDMHSMSESPSEMLVYKHLASKQNGPASGGDKKDAPCCTCSSWWNWTRSAEWWPVWWGFSLFVIIMLTIYVGGFTGPVLPQGWVDSPLDGWSWQTAISFTATALLGWILATPGFEDIVIEKGEKWSKARGRPLKIQIFTMFLTVNVLSLIAYVLGTQTQIKQYGLSNEFWAIIIGMIVINGIGLLGFDAPEFLKMGGKSGETLIKLGLILLGIDLQTVASLGVPGLVVSVPVTFCVITFSYFVGRKLVSEGQRKLAMTISGGLSVCGASAATAVQTVIGATSEELTLAISIITIFTIILMLAVPFAAMAIGFEKQHIAAALGGSINATGAVVAAASFLGDGGEFDEEYVDIAATVKIIQNAFLGFVAVAVAVYWAAVEERFGKAPPEPKAETPKRKFLDTESVNSLTSGAIKVKNDANMRHRKPSDATVKTHVTDATDFLKGKKPGPKWYQLFWLKFPKFVVGFLVLSAALTLIRVLDPPENHDGRFIVREMMQEVSRWWFTLGFVGVGLASQFATLYANIMRGVDTSKMSFCQKVQIAMKPISVYIVGETFNILLTFTIAYVMFKDYKLGQLD